MTKVITIRGCCKYQITRDGSLGEAPFTITQYSGMRSTNRSNAMEAEDGGLASRSGRRRSHHVTANGLQPASEEGEGKFIFCGARAFPLPLNTTCARNKLPLQSVRGCALLQTISANPQNCKLLGE